jgi:hypothetical protein
MGNSYHLNNKPPPSYVSDIISPAGGWPYGSQNINQKNMNWGYWYPEPGETRKLMITVQIYRGWQQTGTWDDGGPLEGGQRVIGNFMKLKYQINAQRTNAAPDDNLWQSTLYEVPSLNNLDRHQCLLTAGPQYLERTGAFNNKGFQHSVMGGGIWTYTTYVDMTDQNVTASSFRFGLFLCGINANGGDPVNLDQGGIGNNLWWSQMYNAGTIFQMGFAPGWQGQVVTPSPQVGGYYGYDQYLSGKQFFSPAPCVWDIEPVPTGVMSRETDTGASYSVSKLQLIVGDN